MKTKDLIGPALDWAVAKCERRMPQHYNGVIRATAHPDHPNSPPMFGPELNYSTNWAQGGPIIEREGIDLHHHRHGDLSVGWDATIDNWDSEHSGPTPLIAAMRCYVASVLGDTVEIPEAIAQ